MPNTTVFVSYAHESNAFRQQVKQLCDWLRSQGVAVVCDFDHAVRPPVNGWATWMQHGIEDAAVVLVVASPKYKARFEKRAPTDSGKGVAWEGAVITQDLYDAAQRNDKFYPVIPDGGSHGDVPKALTPWDNGHRFPSGQEGVLELIRSCANSGDAVAIPTRKLKTSPASARSTAYQTKQNMQTTPSTPVIVLMTVNGNETQALWDVFIGKGAAPSQCTKGAVTYSDLGVHGGNRIWHTVCEMGAGAVGGSQQSASDAIEHWKPTAVIAVGIAFGLDETKQAIGDVLVAKQIQDYELARLNSDGLLTPRADKPSTSKSLVSRLAQIDQMQQRLNGGKKWPTVRFGLVLSGQKLVDDLDYRESLKKLFTEAIGGEMEGSGLYASAHAKKVDWLVIKAICDWGHNKNQAMKDKWQKLAARNAAYVLKAALEVDGLYEASAAFTQAQPAVSKKSVKPKTVAPIASVTKPLPSDAQRLAEARSALQTYLACDQLKDIQALSFVGDLPLVLSKALAPATGQLSRKAIAENSMQALVTIAKTFADHAQNLADKETPQATKRKNQDVRSRLINAMQIAILLSARQEKLLDRDAAFNADARCELEVGSVLAAIVQLRLGNLAQALKAEFSDGLEPVWTDNWHLRGLNAVELGTVERNSISGAKVEYLKVLYSHLHYKQLAIPDFSNNPNATDALLAKARQMKIDGANLLIVLEGSDKSKAISSALLKWMIEDTHVGVITISTQQGVFEVTEGTWTVLLEKLFQTLKPFE